MNTNKIIIVLGSPNSDDGLLYDVAIQRCELALKAYKKTPCKILLTGGFGVHFNKSNKPHAFYLGQHLIQSGVAKTDILEYIESSNTIEDATMSIYIFEKYTINNATIITSDFHLERAKFIFNKVCNNSNINFTFLATKTDQHTSQIDIDALKKHEVFALNKLKKYGIDNYYKI